LPSLVVNPALQYGRDLRWTGVAMKEPAGRQRAVVQAIEPAVDGGRYPVKRILGESLAVTADIFADGHDALAARLRYRKQASGSWHELPMEHGPDDRWRASFTPDDLGTFEYTIHAWVDHFHTWQRDLAKKLDAGQQVSLDLKAGASLLAQAAKRAGQAGDKSAGKELQAAADSLDSGKGSARQAELALSSSLRELADRFPDRSLATEYDRILSVTVDRERAGFSAWYELFPRSVTSDLSVHGTLQDVIGELPSIAEMGFDVLYLSPIHPIGTSHRKGPNNEPQAGPGDPGSPWAIGGPEGGHKAIHPELGDLTDFKALVKAAEQHKMEVALDLAYQCSPDHPYVEQHPEWFRRRPDGSIQYAENPPKKYQDIYPFDFETEDWRALWDELRSIVDYWVEQGVRIFRVDNPHTKPFAFWHWLISEIHANRPDIIFLSEAFTRPKVMHQLAKVGFTQSYTYFTWRNSSWELRSYLEELTRPPQAEYFRPNLWPNTPDILTEFLQSGGPPAFRLRLVLAATLSANYGLYGPAFEVAEGRPLQAGSEEYLHSEKYQIRQWDTDSAKPMRQLISRINRVRRDNPALQRNTSLRFHGIDNDQMLVYSKRSTDRKNVILVVANVDPYHTQGGWLDLDLAELGLGHEENFQVHDLLTDSRFNWRGGRNFVELNPLLLPAHVFRVRRHLRSEHDFEYFL